MMRACGMLIVMAAVIAVLPASANEDQGAAPAAASAAPAGGISAPAGGAQASATPESVSNAYGAVTSGSTATGTPAASTSDSSAFGYSNFRPGTEVISDGPINPWFILSPGDEIVVSIWGAMVETFNLIVSPEGFVDLPDDGGRISTNGVTLAELRPVIIQHLSQIYAAYINAADPTKSTAYVDVRLGKVRKLLVYVVGEVNSPGAYQIGAGMASVLNILNNAGGVRERGTLREILIRRSGGKSDSIDLYRFFLKGELDVEALSLQPNDYVVVPLKKKSVTINGEVRRPGNFELVGDEGMRQLVEFAGGFTQSAYLKSAQIRRSINNQGETFIDVDLDGIAGTDGADLALVDGDVVTIRKNIQIRTNTVSVSGDGITRPGTYAWGSGMTLSDLIAKAGGLREHAFLDRADLLRTEDDFSKRLVIFSLTDLYAKDDKGSFRFTGTDQNNFPLKEMDQIFVQSSFGMTGEDQFVTLEGHAKEPGKFVLAQNMALYDLIFAHGGYQDAAFRKAAFLDAAHIVRKIPGTVGEQLIAFNLGQLLAGDPAASLTLEPNDVIRLYSSADLAMKKRVTIDGLVKKPGEYPMVEGLTLEDLLVLAGGLRPDSYKVEAVIARTEADGNRVGAPDGTYPTFVVPLESNYVATPLDKKTPLKAFDRITVRNVLGWEPLDVVSIQGEVLYPGSYSLANKNETVSALIAKSGGLRVEALPEGATVRRNRNILALAADDAPTTYEITINLVQALKNPKGPEDIVMKDGDQIFIPTNPGTVEVHGAVHRPLTLQYREGFTIEDYIAICGGYLDKADQEKVLVFAANNAAQAIDGATEPVITPGSTIEVPLIRDSEWLETVEVKGAVLKPARVQFVDGARLGFYLNFCGGFTQNADTEKVVVHLPDGSMLTRKEGEEFNPQLPAGSLVVVTIKPLGESRVGDAK